VLWSVRGRLYRQPKQRQVAEMTLTPYLHGVAEQGTKPTGRELLEQSHTLEKITIQEERW